MDKNTKIINVDLKENSYEILIKRNILYSSAEIIKKIYDGKKIAVVTDENINFIYGDKFRSYLKESGFDVEFIVLEPGEKSKSIEALSYIYSEFARINITRSDMIIAFGGGVVGDCAGFAASTFLRGVPYIQIPTTLLSQVDSSVGGKVAINLNEGKNLVGSFYQPKLVLIDTNMLETLPPRFIKDGMAEVIKYACIEDEEFFYYLNDINTSSLNECFDYIVYKCCNIKRKYVESDEKDLGVRMKLNFGHTIGHAVEKFFNYQKYTHGEAVAIGMYNITIMSEEDGYTRLGTSESIRSILMKFGLEYEMPEIKKEELENITKNDKKNLSNKINLIYLKRIGESNIISRYNLTAKNIH